MKAFMDKDFLLSTESARKLFHDYAEKMPVLDYHCHINPAEIADNRKFTRSSLLRDDFDMRECWDAAVQGYADAQYNIGYMYKNGKGVE